MEELSFLGSSDPYTRIDLDKRESYMLFTCLIYVVLGIYPAPTLHVLYYSVSLIALLDTFNFTGSSKGSIPGATYG